MGRRRAITVKQADPLVKRPLYPPATLSEVDFNTLMYFLWVQSKTGDMSRMIRATRDWVYGLNQGIRIRMVNDNLYITKGKAGSYPCYVAHMDTVHNVVPDDEYKIFFYENDVHKDLFAANPKDMKPRGIGGDDKVGIAIAMMMLRDLPACKVALFRDEETGGNGAREADLTFFNDCQFAIEADRRDTTDIVRNAGGTEMYSDAFAEAIAPAMTKWGYKNAHGALTDVKVLKDNGLNICALNMSCGYYLPHGDTTFVRPGDVARAVEMVRDMTVLLAGQRWEHTYVKPVPKTYTNNYTGGNYYSKKPEFYDFCPTCKNKMADFSSWCQHCKKNVPIAERTRVKVSSDQWCPTCHSKRNGVSLWCSTCKQTVAFLKWLDEKPEEPEPDKQMALAIPAKDGPVRVYDEDLECWVWQFPNGELMVDWDAYDESVADRKALGKSTHPYEDWEDTWGAGEEICPECHRDYTDEVGATSEAKHWYCYACKHYWDVPIGEEKEETIAGNFIEREHYQD